MSPLPAKAERAPREAPAPAPLHPPAQSATTPRSPAAVPALQARAGNAALAAAAARGSAADIAAEVSEDVSDLHARFGNNVVSLAAVAGQAGIRPPAGALATRGREDEPAEEMPEGIGEMTEGETVPEGIAGAPAGEATAAAQAPKPPAEAEGEMAEAAEKKKPFAERTYLRPGEREEDEGPEEGAEEAVLLAAAGEGAEPAAGGAAGEPELTEWEARVSEKTKGIKADGVGRSGVQHVRASGAAAAARAAEERRKQQQGAGNILPDPPEILDPLLPPTDDPVPLATDLVRKASEMKLPDQTMPQLVKTKGDVMPAPPRAPSAEFGSKSVTAYGTEMEALDAREKVETESKNRKELARIKKARKALEKKFKADWAEGKAEPLTLVEEPGPPPAAPMTEQTQADIGKVLATLTLMQETAAKDLVDEARRVTFPGEVLSKELFDEDFGKEGLDIARPYLTRMIEEIGKAAHLKQADIERYANERKEALEKKTELAHAGLTDAAAFEKKKVLDLRQKQSSEAVGAKEGAQAHIKGLVSEFKTGVDPSVVLEKRKQLVTAVSRKQGQQTAAYERAGERREKALSQTHGAYLETYKNAVQTERTNYFKAAWKARRNKPKEKAAAEAEAETQLAPTVSWLRDELVPDLDSKFTRLKKQAADAVISFIANLKSAVNAALQLIAFWADKLTGNLGNFWTELDRKKEDWALQADESAKAWEAERAGAARDALVQDINTIRMQTRYEEEELKRQHAAGAKKLSEQQAKVEQESIESPPGPKDAILTVTLQLKDRLTREECPKLVERFEKKVEELGHEKWREVDAIAQAVEPGGMPADKIGDKIRDATDRIGTLEEQIYEALDNLGPLHSKALKLYYLDTYESDVQDVLESELSGAEEDRALALLNRDVGKAGAATIAYAINPAFPGSGDVSGVMEVLRTTKDPADLRAKFKAEYHMDLDEYLKRSLKGDDLKRAQALISGDPTTRYVTDLKHAVRSEDRKGLEAVYAQIRADVENEAAKVSAKVRGGAADRTTKEWDSQRIEEEVRKRAAVVEDAYNKEAADSAGIFGSTLREDIDKNLKGPERDLALALHESDSTKANAARLKLEDKGGKLKQNFWGTFEVTKGDSKAINNLLAANGERVRRDVERDEEIKLWNRRVENAREQQVAYLRGWSPEQIKELPKWEEEKERKAFAETVKKKTEEHKDDFKNTYEATYGSIGAMLARNVTGDQWDKADHLVKQGGILRPDQKLHYAVVEKDADTVKSFVGGSSEKEMKEVEENWRKSDEGKKWLAHHQDEAGDKAFEKFVLSKFEGDDAFDIKLDIKGRSDDPEEMLARKEQKLNRQKKQYGHGLASGDAYEATSLLAGPPGLGEKDYELRRLEREVAILRGQVSKLRSLEKGSEAYNRVKASYELQLDYIDRAAESHRKAVDRRTDDAAMIVGIVVTAIVIVATGGAATPLLAAIAAGAGAAASIITKAIMKGGAYIGTKEMWTDIVVGVVDTIVSAATAGLGGKLLKGIRPLAQMAKSARLAPRLIAHGLAEGAENFISTIPTSVAQQLMEKGDVSFSQTFTGAAIGAGLGGVLGSVGGFKKPGAALDTADILAHRGTPKQRAADWKLFQQAYPEKSYKNFLDELDAGILSKQAREQVEHEAQRKMRRELFEHIPPAQRGQFKDVPIHEVSDAEFDRFTRSTSGDAVVLVVDGKPRVLKRASADISVLRREGKHLLQSVDPETAHLFRALDEKKFAKWDTLSLDEQFGLYGKKLDLEIDAQKRTLRDLEENLASAGADPAARQRVLGEMSDVQHTLDNLNRRAGEVGSITPQQRRAMRRDPSLRPDYLDQPARLFEKKDRLTIKQELVASLRKEGVDATDAMSVLEKLRVAAESGGPKRPFTSIVRKIETLLKTDSKAVSGYIGDLKTTLDSWVGDRNGALAILQSSTKMKDPRAFLRSASKLTSVVKEGATREARATLDAIAAKVSRMDADAAHKYLDDLGSMIDSFKPRKPSELTGFLRATASPDIGDSTTFIKKLETFNANRKKTGVDLPPATVKEIGRVMADLKPHEAEKFVDALDDFTRSHTPEELRKFDGFVDGAARAKSGDPAKYLGDAKDLIKQKDHGLSHEALEMLAGKAGRGTLDVEWLVQTNIYKEKEARAFFDMAAKDVNTPWNSYRAAARHPDVQYLQDRIRSNVRGMAGEYLTFLLGKELKEAGQIMKDAGSKKMRNILGQAGIEEVTGQQIKVVTDEFGNSVIDASVRSGAGLHGLEVKAYQAEYWETILEAWEMKSLNPYAVLKEEQAEAFASIRRLIRQIKNADAKFNNPPFLMTSTAVGKISGRHKEILEDLLARELPPGTKILTLPESEFPKAEKELKRLFSSK